MRPGALGDALLALPALAAVRAAWAKAHLTFIARSDVLPLITTRHLADTVYSYDLTSWASLWGDVGRADALLTETFAGADALVAWVGDADGTLKRNVAVLRVERIVIAPGRPPEESTEHAAVYLLRTLGPLGLTRTPATPSEIAAHTSPLRPSRAATGAAARHWGELGLPQSRVVALHPGSGGASKCWPPSQFAALAALLQALGFFLLVIHGPADAPAVLALLDTLRPALAPPVLRDAPIEVLAAVLARCAAYVGNDSGVTHLAAQTGIPTLALFGPSDPARWSPVGRRVRVVRADDARLVPMSALTVERVAAELERMLLEADR
jgi:ADP-heptose:LPS heptosyltransferase